MEDQARSIIGRNCGREVSGDVSDEETVGFYMQSCGTSEDARQERVEAIERDHAASIFEKEFSGEVGVAALYASVAVADRELS
jgi:hypothetical protein